MARTAAETILNPSVLKKLDEIRARHDELVAKLSDPEVIGNSSLYQTCVRQHGALLKKVEIYGNLRKVLEDKESAASLAEAEGDAEMAELAKEELQELARREEDYCEELQNLLLQDDATDARDAIIEIRAGTGGDEAGLFAHELHGMYIRYAERMGWKAEQMSISWNEAGGIKEAILSIQGRNAYGQLKFEAGGHRVQRVPVTETSGRIHTSLATVAVLPEVEDVEIEVKQEDLKVDLFCASGPGGQSVNKTTSAVRLTHLPTGVVVSCQDERSQHKNRAKAKRVLRARLYDQHQRDQVGERAATRKSMVGSGDRSDKVRTYNFPQDRITDHRLSGNFFGVERTMLGEIDSIVDALLEKERVEKLQNFDALIGSQTA